MSVGYGTKIVKSSWDLKYSVIRVCRFDDWKSNVYLEKRKNSLEKLGKKERNFLKFILNFYY